MQPPQRIQTAAEVAVPAGLHQLHPGCQVDAQRIDRHRLAQRPDFGGRHPGRLDQSDVAQHQRRLCMLANLKRPGRFGPHQHRPLRPQTKAKPSVSAARARVVVYLLRFIGAPGHRAQHNRRFEHFASQRRRQVNFVVVPFGNRLVNELNLVEQRALWRNSTSPDAHSAMCSGLALADQRKLRPLGVLLTHDRYLIDGLGRKTLGSVCATTWPRLKRAVRIRCSAPPSCAFAPPPPLAKVQRTK